MDKSAKKLIRAQISVLNRDHILLEYSINHQLTGQKSNPIFSPVKIPYRTHSILNTISRLHRIML